MPAGRGEAGTITPLILGFVVILISLIVGGIAVTSAQVARMQLYDVSDAAALDAADAIDGGAYTRGVGDAVPIASRTVAETAVAYVAGSARPHAMLSWTLLPGTGSPDGRTAVVRMSCVARLPLVGGLISALGGSVTIHAESRARAGLDPLP
ncbi:MAG: pilus assembly protein TadG-related protein [Nostocoides sp.]